MATSASSSQVPRDKYDVFISFRGSDIRHGFLSHLTKELRQKGIDVYVDERLKSGGEISLALLEAIEGSMISLVIFSKDYASSKWCLEELVKIMDCKEANDQIVIPVFYNVDPSHVRHQKGSYADAFTKHEQKYKVNKDKLPIWRSTITKAANLSGYHYSSNFQNESKLIDEIVEDVMKKLEDTDPIEPKFLVGFDQNFASVESLMEIELQEVRVLGIWGTGGIGKTTLAHAIFDKFFSKFESCCFLENVREESKRINGLSYLRQKLLSKLLSQENPHMNDEMRTRSNIRRLRRKKVLIVFDDVDTSQQLKDLAGEQLYLGPGSRVIVTSRDKHVLISGGIHVIHEVKELNFENSLKLFCLNAFNQSHPEMEYEELSKMTVAYAKGIPLALEVLGSHFHSRDKAYWESELNKLLKYPHQQIQNIFKISYDGLDAVDKEIFLDIAFFFVGEQKDKATWVLEACGFKAVSGIENLVNKALMKILEGDIIKMHDLIREMGEQIVREESTKHPRKRSRLSDSKEVYDLLKDNMGTEEIEGIMLDMTQIRDLQLRVDTFTKMRNLRILKFYSHKWNMRSHIKLPHDIESFPNKLRYFHWQEYPLESLPLGFCPENLVELCLEGSNVKRLWDGIQELVNLKAVNLSQSRQLIELPDFSMACKLERVDLELCGNLRSVHPSILSLHSLVELNLTYCSKLESLESETHLKSLIDLNVLYCQSLKKFCLSSEKMTTLYLEGSEIEILHLPIGRFTELRELLLNGPRLRTLPINELCCLTSLEEFHLNNFSQVIHTTELHALLDAWYHLRELNLNGCSKLLGIPDNISALCYLSRLNLNGCSNLSEIPYNIGALTMLECLSLADTSVEILPACIEHLSNLREIYLRKCKRLRSILALPPVLEVLDASECSSLETVFSSPFQQEFLDECRFEFQNCANLEKNSLCFIRKLTHISILAACEDNNLDSIRGCYPGSKVPKRIRYKQTAKASRDIEFTCNLHQSLGILFCCVLPQFTSRELTIGCNYSDDDNHKSYVAYNEILPLEELNSDHVYLWYEKFIPNDPRTSYHGKIACEFSVRYWNDHHEFVDSDILIQECGVCPIYASKSEWESELYRKRKRDVDIDVAGLLPTKKLKKSCAIQHFPLGLGLELQLATKFKSLNLDDLICMQEKRKAPQ